ncbi:single-stranded-DNA-specific exonuclease RecJ [Candidatus Saccharibacteria bacterium]|nr:single-stranded-DNA-specific exonuclease RecJ [Candidatus Saccharibacteria bacterium]
MASPSAVFKKLLNKRGQKTDQQIKSFLHPNYKDLHDPMLLPDMKSAVDRLKLALDKQEKLMIFGDYDADGVTATSVLYLGLKQLGFTDIAISLPNRIKDGYGISRSAVSKMKKTKATLALSVDCGSKDNEIIDDLKAASIDAIITDHHEVGETLPNAIAVINPKREDSKYPFRGLAGVAVAFKLIQALQISLKPKSMPIGQEKWLLDLVAIGTICDCMDLVDENRILAHYGFRVIGKTRRRGLKELMRSAYSGGHGVGSYLVGFVIGPRINAAGRLSDPIGALKVFLCGRAPDVAAAVKNLEQLNDKRRSIQDKGAKDAEKQIMDSLKGNQTLPHVLFVKLPDLHEGVIGIVAGKLIDRFKRPIWVFTQTENGHWKGSGRSFGDYSLAELITRAKGIYERGGGHKEAAGVTVKNIKKLNDFIKCANNLYVDKKLEHEAQAKFLLPVADMEMKSLNDLTFQFAQEITTMEPFGRGNEQPIFKLIDMLIVGRKRIKEKYLAITVRDKEGKEMDLMSFRPNEEWFDVKNGTSADFLINLEANEWRDRQSARGIILDLQQNQDQKHPF